MQNNDRIDNQSEHQFRRAVSLDPTMSASELTRGQVGIHLNPMYEHPNDETTDASHERNSSLRRQVSEPARNRNRIISNIVTRTESIKSIVMRGTQQFFGINEDNDSDKELWRQRRLRLLRNYGKLKQTEQPIIGLKSRVSTEEGFDETDGVLQSNRLTAFTDNERQSAPEDTNSRSPALKVTFKAIAMASNALKKKMSNRSERQTRVQSKSEGTDDRNQSLTVDSLFYPSDELMTQFDEDFFVKPSRVSQELEETDGRRGGRDGANKWVIQRQESVRAKSIPEKLIETLLKTDNSNRREYGLGVIDKLLNRKLKTNLTKEQQNAINDHIDDSRPYFTYWVTTVQILILIISLSVYGFGHFGFGGFAHITGLVKVKSLSLQEVDFFEPQNFWLGPRPADLIHLGAKYTPCMRRDDRIYEIIEEERDIERGTGCCIRNDGSGCVQSAQAKCSPLLSTWHKWTRNTLDRSSGPVCGQDPLYCEQPASIEPYIWADDITKWPICRKKAIERLNSVPHMRCEVVARPCCLGVYGQCQVTTREYCDFIKGFFHEEATLCSQVSCMENVCGMIPFYSRDRPDQFYRIWIPIFLHAGLGHLVITVLFQFFLMREIEKMTGFARMAIIYLVSGVGGYLASAVFLPFRPEVGPAGSLYGVLACFFVELINMWSVMEKPYIILAKQLGAALFLFLLGLLPWIDNYAHITGFIIGFLLSLALMPPYLSSEKVFAETTEEKEQKRRHRVVQIVVCLATVLLIIITLFVLLYEVPIYDITFLKYFNCIPFTPDWCANQDIRINRVDIL